MTFLAAVFHVTFLAAVVSCDVSYDIMSPSFVTVGILFFMTVPFPGYLHLSF